jgi:hypothetical protein
MRKIKDRFVLGAIAGIGGNLAKLAISQVSFARGIAEITGPQRAAGMLVAGHRIMTPLGQTAGFLADGAIAGLLGVLFTYMMSITGKDYALLKGSLGGEVAWTALYGTLATMGATTVKGVSPPTVVTEFMGHTAYGLAAAGLIAMLGDPGLFNSKVPISASGPLSSTWLGRLRLAAVAK